ncbi:MAG: HAMP domain-containing protein, partial [candidate division Zixibacteria bacterium]|nr:HAMP domain-containing protein [candidate division Zixibacteria bacterium]NIR65852.1 HAMP domain-containing protein [candidate division Zixibacteria bacterium]NIS47506.1 HAMP domain-containing protein [candidate division Zixibacteria bacterium]NIU15603.1 HAMP domain-containing protein [candidate division Zixibacteria bacterium]NIV07748.1 HAMP domain-containing protein [candidate division Zixibacteria bacterium]
TYQEIALQTLIPVLLAIFLASIILGLYVRGQLRSVTGSLENLAKESERIIEGDLETAFSIDSSDEVGQLSR